ncbi:MAG: stage II sporulation protein M [Victivallales bacterium]|nr:stage II sporulation protein M [Victivallales bacterium]
MILDVKAFVEREKTFWKELESFLDRRSDLGQASFSVDEIKRFSYLYSRVSEDLVKISTLSGEDEIQKYLQILVSRAYSHVHGGSRRGMFPGFKATARLGLRWFLVEFPDTFRRNFRFFAVSATVFAFGATFGGVAVVVDNDAKEVLIPEFSHLMQSPGERVKHEENTASKETQQYQAQFAAHLMTNNIQVSINALVLGIFWGFGTIVLLFYNGVILGCVAVDYILDGHLVFLMGWILPHGSVEIPAILIAGQAGIILGYCMLKPAAGGRTAMLKAKAKDICSLIGGVAVILVWAAIIEAFFSQYHEPAIPYAVKIFFGTVELALLAAFLSIPIVKKKNGKV